MSTTLKTSEPRTTRFAILARSALAAQAHAARVLCVTTPYGGRPRATNLERPAESHRWALDNQLHIPWCARNSNRKIRDRHPQGTRFYRHMRQAPVAGAAERARKYARNPIPCHCGAGRLERMHVGPLGPQLYARNARNCFYRSALQRIRRAPAARGMAFDAAAGASAGPDALTHVPQRPPWSGVQTRVGRTAGVAHSPRRSLSDHRNAGCGTRNVPDGVRVGPHSEIRIPNPNYLMPSSSISKISVAFCGITGGRPASP